MTDGAIAKIAAGGLKNKVQITLPDGQKISILTRIIDFLGTYVTSNDS